MVNRNHAGAYIGIGARASRSLPSLLPGWSTGASPYGVGVPALSDRSRAGPASSFPPTYKTVIFYLSRVESHQDRIVNIKGIVTGGIVGGILLEIAMLASSALAAAVLPYDVLAIGGMRAVDDPVMALFFTWPFVFSFAAAVVFERVQGAFDGSAAWRGVRYGTVLFLLYTIPNLFVVYTSMDYPAGFYLANLLFGIVGFPLLGVLLVRLAER